jgi:hypothetical protein
MNPKPPDNRTIVVDWNNPQSLNQTIMSLAKRRSAVLKELGFTPVTFNGSRHSVDKLLPLLEEIYSADLSSVYNGSDGNKIYHVYFHCDPRKRLSATLSVKHLFLAIKFSALQYEPFYVGKGTGNRYLDLARNDTQLIARDKDVVPVKVVSGLTEGEALSLEAKMIDILGLQALSKHGMLVNLDEGASYQKRRSIYGKIVSTMILKRNGFPL